MFLINKAYAESGSAALPEPSAGEQLMSTLFMFGPILVIFYFLLIRPQQKKLKQHQAMVTNLRRGDKVITSGGIIGKISKVNSDKGTLSVEIAEGVEVEVLSATVTSIVDPAAKPINDNNAGKK